jgi:hypothetical protein
MDGKSAAHKLSFDEFKLYYESTEKVTDRRLETNRWNYSICIAMLVAIAVLARWSLTTASLLWIGFASIATLSVMAVLFCALWVGQIRDFKKLNNAKFMVLNDMAPHLEFDPNNPGAVVSYCPFEKEWTKLNDLSALDEGREVEHNRSKILEHRVLYSKGIRRAVRWNSHRFSDRAGLKLAAYETGAYNSPNGQPGADAGKTTMKYFYVICPVGADPRFAAKKAVLEKLCDEWGYEPFFPLERHREFSVGVTTRDMQRAEFVLTDLSLERPSCYFELELAEAANARVFLVAAAGTPIHQVGNAGSVVFYSDMVQYRSAVSQILELQDTLSPQRY